MGMITATPTKFSSYGFCPSGHKADMTENVFQHNEAAEKACRIQSARDEKDFRGADQIRDTVIKSGGIVTNTKRGTHVVMGEYWQKPCPRGACRSTIKGSPCFGAWTRGDDEPFWGICLERKDPAEMEYFARKVIEFYGAENQPCP